MTHEDVSDLKPAWPRWRCRLHAWYYFIPQTVALIIVAPLAWMALERTPPLRLHHGELFPSVVYPGQSDIEVVWQAHFSGRDCPGDTQRELIDSQANLWPKLRRARGGVFHPRQGTPREGTVTTPPLDIPSQMEPGPAEYRVTQFYYCNWLQRVLHWPIIETSEAIPFMVIPRREGVR